MKNNKVTFVVAAQISGVSISRLRDMLNDEHGSHIPFSLFEKIIYILAKDSIKASVRAKDFIEKNGIDALFPKQKVSSNPVILVKKDYEKRIGETIKTSIITHVDYLNKSLSLYFTLRCKVCNTETKVFFKTIDRKDAKICKKCATVAIKKNVAPATFLGLRIPIEKFANGELGRIGEVLDNEDFATRKRKAAFAAAKAVKTLAWQNKLLERQKKADDKAALALAKAALKDLKNKQLEEKERLKRCKK